jgi:polyribonucleotide nucleotidyltransferase
MNTDTPAVAEKSQETEESSQDMPKGHNAVIAYDHGSSDMGIILESGPSFSLPKVGNLIKGSVLDISKNGIVVNISGKLTGLVRGKELDDESGQYSKLSLGDDVEATVLEIAEKWLMRK